MEVEQSESEFVPICQVDVVVAPIDQLPGRSSRSTASTVA